MIEVEEYVLIASLPFMVQRRILIRPSGSRERIRFEEAEGRHGSKEANKGSRLDGEAGARNVEDGSAGDTSSPV
jgi:hypothetical protein